MLRALVVLVALWAPAIDKREARDLQAIGNGLTKVSFDVGLVQEMLAELIGSIDRDLMRYEIAGCFDGDAASCKAASDFYGPSHSVPPAH